LNESTRAFTVVCAFEHNGYVKALPQRAWNSKRRLWDVKDTRLNAISISEWPQGAYAATPAAKARIDELLLPPSASDGRPYPESVAGRMRVQPYPYQRALLEQLHGMKTAAVFMDTGTGKTKIGVDLASAWRVTSRLRRVIVFSPLSIRNVWRRHVEQQAVGSHRVFAFGGDTTKYRKWLAECDDFDGVSWLLVGVETPSGASQKTITAIHAFFAETFAEECACFVDESTKIKSHKAKRTEAVIEIGALASRRLIFTGTPTSTGLIDLWAQYEFLSPDIIGSGGFYPFKLRYAVMGGYENKQIVGYRRISEFTQLVSPFTVQARKREVLTQLPPKTYEVREIELNPRQRAVYRDIKSKKGGMETSAGLVKNALEKALRLREAVGGHMVVKDAEGAVIGREPLFTMKADRTTDNPKLEELIAVLEESDEQTLIWCAFRSELALVADRLCRIYGDDAVGELHGDVDEHARQKLVDDFQAGRVRFIVGNTATGGLGLTLTAATLMVFYSNTDSYIDRQQAEDRFHRIGQLKPVTVVDLIALNTIDERIAEAHSNKLSLSEYIRARIASGEADPFDTMEQNQ
jgi:SNF2 family DNA or RNA helicase